VAIGQETGTARHQRADAARNRQRLLAVAKEVFRERGLDASVGEIAERAGVGRATLFRNFPTKQELIIAVVVERIQEGLAEGEAMLDSAGDQELLFPFLKELIGRQNVDRALFESVGEEAFLTDKSMLQAHAAIIDLIDRLIAHDQKLGYVREGLGAVDMLMLIKGACAVATSMSDLGPQALERHLSLVRGAIAAPGRRCPLEGSAPTIDDLHSRRSSPVPPTG
jgi:AcrR family transcriptional regulator